MMKAKKSIAVLFAVLLMSVLFSLGAYAQDATVVESGSCGENAVWTLYDDGTFVVSGEGAMRDYATENSSVSAPWSQYASRDIKKVVIEEGITTVGGGAFEACRVLGEVELPSTLVAINRRAFDYCDSLRELNLPAALESFYLNSRTFSKGLEAVYVDENNKFFSSVDGVLFNKNETVLLKFPAKHSADIYTVPTTVEEIGATAFVSAANVKEIVLAEKTVNIGEEAFYGCTSLEKINLPEGVEQIKQDTFGNCSSLKSIDFPESLTTIETKAFSGCESITSLVLSDNIMSVGYCAFEGCYGIETLVTGDKMKAIGPLAFMGCQNLKSVHIGKSIKVISTGAFTLSPIENVTIDENNSEFLVEDGAIFNEDKTELVYYFGKPGETEYSIPSGVTSIASGAFFGNQTLVSVTLPEGIKKVPFRAFAMCYALESVTLPESLEKIDVYAFAECVSLPEIVIPDSVTEIGEDAFAYCASLASFNVPAKLEKMGYDAFDETAWYQAQEEEWLYLDNWLISYNSENNPYDSPVYRDLVIPEGIVGISDRVFVSHSPHINDIYVPSSVRYFGYNPVPHEAGLIIDENNPYFILENGILFNKDKTVVINSVTEQLGEEVIIPEGVTEIADGAFEDGVFTSVVLPSTLKIIGNCAFGNCYRLESVVIPEGVTAIGNEGFFWCDNLIDITLPSTLEKMGEHVFEGTAWYEAQPDGMLYVGNVFYDYKNGEGYDGDVVIKDGTKIIAGTACYYMLDIKSVTIPDSVTYIGGGAFAVCYNLREVYMSKNIKEIGNGAFAYASGIGKVHYEGTEEDWNNIIFIDVVYEEELFDSCCLFYDTDDEEHVHSQESEAIVSKPTCTEDGEKEIFCSCGESWSEVITATGHSFTDYIFNEDATCTADGTKTAKCDNCDATDTVAAEGTMTPDVHNFSRWEAVGNTQNRECLVCGLKESKTTTEDGDVEIEAPGTPDKDFVVDEVEKGSDNYILVEELIKNNVEVEVEVLKAFDINLKNHDGVHVQPDGSVKVKLPNDWSKQGVYKVYRVNDDGTLTDMNAYRQGSHLVFDTDHFSVYVIVVENEQSDDEPETPDTPETPDEEEEVPLGIIGKIVEWFRSIIDKIKNFFRSIGGRT